MKNEFFLPFFHTLKVMRDLNKYFFNYFTQSKDVKLQLILLLEVFSRKYPFFSPPLVHKRARETDEHKSSGI